MRLPKYGIRMWQSDEVVKYEPPCNPDVGPLNMRVVFALLSYGLHFIVFRILLTMVPAMCSEGSLQEEAEGGTCEEREDQAAGRSLRDANVGDHQILAISS